MQRNGRYGLYSDRRTYIYFKNFRNEKCPLFVHAVSPTTCSLLLEVPMKQFTWLPQYFSTFAKTEVARTRNVSHDSRIPVLGFSDSPFFLRKRMEVLNRPACKE